MAGSTEYAIREVKRIWEQHGHEPPLDLDVVCDILGIRLVKRELPFDGFQFRRSDGMPYIVITSNVHIPVGRKRFSVAHEIAHYLHDEYDLSRRKRLIPVHLSSKQSEDTRLESWCNHIAGMLLMPRGIFRKMWLEYSENRSCRERILADWFEVTPLAVRVRAAHLKLTKTRVGKFYR